MDERERLKYERMWEWEVYRQNSPGERLVEYFLEKCAPETADQIIDFGCGTGRVGLYLKNKGYRVGLLDIVANSLDLAVREALDARLWFAPVNLWELPNLRGQRTYQNSIFSCDYFLCMDVLEHIPPDKVERVLDNIACRVRKGGIFSIALSPDSYGNLIGETLHLSIAPRDYWLSLIRKRWEIVETKDERGTNLIVVVKTLTTENTESTEKNQEER